MLSSKEQEKVGSPEPHGHSAGLKVEEDPFGHLGGWTLGGLG